MIFFDGLKVKDLESGLFIKYCFVLFNFDFGRYVMELEIVFLCFYFYFNFVIIRIYFFYIVNGICLRYVVYLFNFCMSMVWGVVIIV